MSEEIKDMIEPIPNWEFTYRYDGSRTCGKSYTQSLLDEKRQQIKDLQQKVEQLEKENDKLKHKLNDIAFGDDSELALRFLRKIDYVDFDEKRKVYINKHNNEPFILKDEQEKDYYLKDEELNEYTQQLEYKVEQLENIRKEAIEYINNNNHIDGCLIKWEVADLLNILNKGDNNGK